MFCSKKGLSHFSTQQSLYVNISFQNTLHTTSRSNTDTKFFWSNPSCLQNGHPEVPPIPSPETARSYKDEGALPLRGYNTALHEAIHESAPGSPASYAR